MTMKSNALWSDRFLLTVPFILVVWGFSHFFGPLDSISRFHSSGYSPDGELKVEVYRKRASLFPSRIDVIVKVFDRNENLIYERRVFEESMWSELNNLLREIKFTSDEIRIGPTFNYKEYVVIKKVDLNNGKS